MSKPRRQHWVPKLYLRAFATPDTVSAKDPDVWVFPKEQGDPFRTSISNVAAESFLYSPRTASGERDFAIEESLADLEGTIAPLWRIFAEAFVDLEDSTVRKGIGLFLATLFHRNPQRTDDHSYIIAAMTSQSKPEGPTDSKTIRSSEKLHKRVREELKDVFVHTLLVESGSTAERLMRKRWTVVVADNSVFATSDHPFMVMHEDVLLRSFGFLVGTILVPVSPTRMMILDDNHEEGNNYYKLQPDTLGAFHGLVLRHALRFMISSRPSDEVLLEMAEVADRLDQEDSKLTS